MHKRKSKIYLANDQQEFTAYLYGNYHVQLNNVNAKEMLF